jgi:hypothetical protein
MNLLNSNNTRKLLMCAGDFDDLMDNPPITEV